MMAEFLESLGASIRDENTRAILIGIVLTIAAVALFLFVVRLTGRLLQRAHAQLDLWRNTRIPPLRLQNYEIISSDHLTDLLKKMINGVRFAALAVVLYVFVPLVLSFFPWTRGLVARYFPYIAAPVVFLFQEFVAFIPNLFFIIIIIIITRYILKFTGAFFGEIQKGTIVFPKFHVDWVAPTAKLLRVVIILLAVIMISPYLPGFGSPAFQGISIFLGVLLSLGSTAAVANMVAGAALIYMRSFSVGDRVKIADTTGDVVEKTLLVTRIRTVKNVEVTIPNALVLGCHIINYSALAQTRGLIIYASITIGYDVPWRTVHKLLLDAAAHTAGTLQDPPPFVLQTGLNDFAVSYEINLHIADAAAAARIQSELFQNIQDAFNTAGVEILSPTYTALRDGNEPVLPDEYLPKTQAPRGFRIFPRAFLHGKPGRPRDET